VPALTVMLMGRKPGAADALEYLLQRGHRVAAVISSEPRAESGPRWLHDAAAGRGIAVLSDEEAYARLAGQPADPLLANIDLVLSYLHRRRIRPALIDLPRVGCFNFHPAPLPELRGVAGYNFAVLENMAEYGVSVHWVSPELDTGDIVEVKRFPIDPASETALSLERKAQAALFALFTEFIRLVEENRPLPALRQGPGRYISRKQMLAAMRILPEDTPELIDRKARAFWFPPYQGACIEVGGRRFTVVPDLVLRELGGSFERELRT